MKNAARIGCLLIVMALLAPDRARAQQGQFMWPVSLAVGGATGNVGIVVSENARHRISVYDRSDALIVRFGARGVSDGQFNNPAGVAVDSQGFIYVADLGNSRIQKFEPTTGNFVTKWGSPGTGQGQFRKPRAIAVDAQNNVSVLDSETGKVQKFSPDGTTHLGSWGGSLGTGDGQFSPLAGGPADLVIDAAGFAYVSDTANQRIQKWRIVSDASGNIQSADFVGWSGRCMSGSNCDMNNNNQRSNGFSCTATTCSAPVPPSGNGAGQFTNPAGLTLDSAGRDLFVTDSLNHRVQQFNSSGNYVRHWGTRGSLPGELRNPVDIALKGAGLYVADFLNQRVQVFGLEGDFFSVFGAAITLSASLGYPAQPLDSLVDPNPLFMFPGFGALTVVRATSQANFQQAVTLAATGCCQDLLSGVQIPSAVDTTFGTPTLSVPPRSWQDSVLVITAPASTSPGRLLIPIVATSSLGGGSADLAAEIVVVPPDRGAVPPCVATVVFGSGGIPSDPGILAVLPELLPLSAVTSGLYALKAASPSKTSFSLGAASRLETLGAGIDVAKATSPLGPGQAVVVFKNTSSLDKEITTVNSANCLAAAQTVRLAPNQSATLVISTADTTTLLLRDKYCASWFLGCWQYAWRSRAIFDDGAFWRLFGGRQVTIDWFT